MKKIMTIIIAAMIFILAGLTMKKKEYTAQTADFSVKIDNQTVKKDEEFTFTVQLTSIASVKKIEAYLKYDSEQLEFISAKESSVVGASGMLTIHDEFEQPIHEITYAITMKALETGSSDITIDDIYLEDDTNSDIIEINRTSATIKVGKNTQEEKNANLSLLRVFPGELIPSFQADVTEYQVQVDHDVTELILSAEPFSEDSVVSIDQPIELAVGDNDVIITVTAASGNSKKYRLNVNRAK